jgi:hypothetical protein
MGLRGWLKRLERAAAQELAEIPQRDGPAGRFPRGTVAEAFICLYEGRDHPLLAAARNSSDPKWSQGVYADDPAIFRDVPDLSE